MPSGDHDGRSWPATAARRYVRVRGSFKYAGGAGANSLRFTGRVGGRRLRRGSYRLVARALDAAGNKSAAKTKRFRIRR